MISNLPKQRDLWILLLVLIVGAIVIVVLKTGDFGSNFAALGAGGEMSASLVPSASPTQPADNTGPVQAPSLESLPADTREQFDALPAGTVLVACSPAFAKYPDRMVPSTGGVWLMTHPGWHILLHGYCVDNPSAIRSFEPQVLDAP